MMMRLKDVSTQAKVKHENREEKPFSYKFHLKFSIFIPCFVCVFAWDLLRF